MNDVEKEIEDAEKLDKKLVQQWLRQINDGLVKYEEDEYLSKKHLLDYVDKYLSMMAEEFDISLES